MASPLASLATRVRSELDGLSSSKELSKAETMQLLSSLNELRDAIQPDFMAEVDITLSPHSLVACRIGMAMGIFDAFAEGSDQAMTFDELQTKTKGDPMLLSRMMRLLTAERYFKQLEPNRWQPLPKAIMFSHGGSHPAAIVHHYGNLRVQAELLEYLEKTNFKNPDDAYDGPWQYALKTEHSFFDYLAGLPDRYSAFNVMMSATNEMRDQDWFDFYPVKEKLSGVSMHDVLLVDIGGGIGKDISNFRKAFPDLSGRAVLQDRPNVIKDIDPPLSHGIEAQPHDMFEQQPIKNAKAYYFRTVLHDWPDKQALLILKRIRDAMGPDSRLLINENLYPESGAPPIVAKLDFIMMYNLAALERSQSQWIALVEKAGFKVLDVWRPPIVGRSPVGLIEAARAD